MIHVSKVAIIGQSSVVGDGIARILVRGPFAISHSTNCAQELVAAVGRHSDEVDLVLLDGSELENIDQHVGCLTRHLPTARIALITESFDYQAMLSAIRSGVHGIIVAENSCECLLESLKLIAVGERVLPSQLADHLVRQGREQVPNPQGSGNSALSPREMDIVRCLVMGCPNKTIARKLDISESSVKVHVKAVLRKIPVRNRTQAAIWAAHRFAPATAPRTARHPIAGALATPTSRAGALSLA